MTTAFRIIALGCLVAAGVSCGGDDDSNGETADPATDSAGSIAAEPEETAAVTNGANAADSVAVEPDDTNAASDNGDVAETEPEGTAAAIDTPPPTAGVCSLATDEEIGAIIANPVMGVDIDPTLCEYAQETGAPGVGGTTVDVAVTDAFDDVCSLEFDITGAADAPVIDGIGTRAAWKASSQTPQLFICTETSFVAITQYRPSSVTDDEALARAEAIADVVLDGL